jgi:lysosomal Pro-X carboxypeptidase
LATAFRLCEPLKDGDQLSDWLEAVYFNLAMVDYPYPSSFLEPLPGWPIEQFCFYLKDEIGNDEDLLRSLFTAVSVYFNYTQTKHCLNLSQDAVSSLGEKGWDYQACTEMIMPLCTNGRTDMFRPNPWNLEERIKECRTKWKVEPRPNAVVMEYGGKDIKEHSNIVFSNGGLDPWSAGGVLKTVSESVVAVVIPNGAHHLDLRAATKEDPPELVKAREIEEEYIRKWIKSYASK